ncbi:lysozyme family protein [Peribacillus asahii]
MMKRKRTRFNITFGIATLFFICVMILLFHTIEQFLHSTKTTTETIAETKVDSFADVKKYSSLLEDELEKYELEEYTIVLLSLMQQESRGKGGDPMQSSESAGLAPNTITDPKESIKQGVKHFRRVLQYGKKKDVDFPTIIQSYNMGIGYIHYIAKNGGTHSEELAKSFSMIQVKKNPKLYNCGGDKDNFRYPYCYGDFTYTTKVTENIEMISNDSIPTMSTEQITGKAF